MKKLILSVAACAILFAANGLAQDKYIPWMQKESKRIHDQQLKSGIVGSYPQHTEEFNWETDWVLFQTIETSYNSSGDPVVVESNQGGERTRVTHSYDSQGNETEVLTQMMTGGVWVNLVRTVATYNSSGYEVQIHADTWNGTTWVMNSGTEYDYTMNGDLVTSVIIKNWASATSTWDNVTRETYSYNGSDPHMATVILENWISNAWVTSLKQEYTWTGDRPTQVIESSNVNGDWVVTGKNVYDWKENDSFTATSYTFEDPLWVESFRLVSTNDSHGNATLFEADFYYGTTWMIVSGSKFDLTYSGNDLTQRITQQYTIAQWQNSKKEIFSNFASLGTGVSVMPDSGLSVYPNPAGKQATVRITHLNPGAVTLSLLSITGQKVLGETVNGNGSDIHYELNLNGVPRGTYLLMAIDRNGAEIGKVRLIKE